MGGRWKEENISFSESREIYTGTSKRYNYISIKIQAWISRSFSRFIFLFFFQEKERYDEEIKNHSSGSWNATYVEISCPRLNATAAATAGYLLFYDPENSRTIRESSVRRMRESR